MINKSSRNNFIFKWKKNRIKIIMTVFLVIIIICYYYNQDEGTWSENLNLSDVDLFNSLALKDPVFTKQSKGEIICRKYLERVFNKPFPSVRPDFLKNEITGKNLEIDCFNQELMLGIEYNGQQHYKFIPGMHKNFESFRLQQYRDSMKQKKCKEYGINLIVVPYMIPHQSIENYIREQLILLGYIS